MIILNGINALGACNTKEKVEEMVKETIQDFENMRMYFDSFVIPVKLGFEEFKKERYQPQEFTMTKKLALGLQYMDVVEYFFDSLKLHHEFMKLAQAHDLLISIPQDEELSDRDYRLFREYADYSNCKGQSINHDRYWVLTGINQRCFIEGLLVEKMLDFGESVSDLINFIAPFYDDTPDKPFDLYAMYDALERREQGESEL